jgi:hypothetical protein
VLNWWRIIAAGLISGGGNLLPMGENKRERVRERRRVRIMGQEIESKIADGIIAAAPDQESAAIAKSMIDTGKIVIMGVSF